MSQAQKQNYPDSLKLLLKLVRIRPTKGLYWFNLGNIYFFLNQFPFAITSYQHVVDLKSPLTPAAHLYIAKAQRRQGNLDSSLSELDGLVGVSLPPALALEAEKERESVAEEWLKQALNHYQGKDYERALLQVNRSLAIKRLPEAESLRGLILLQQGQTEAARTSWRSALGLSSDETQKQDLKDLLNYTSRRGRNTEASHSLLIDNSTSYNSNYYARPEDESLPARASLDTSFFYDRHLIRKPGSEVAVSALFENMEVIGAPKERFTRGLVQGLTAVALKDWNLYAMPRLEFDIKSASPYAWRYGLGITAERVWQSQRVGISLQHIRNLGLGDDGAYLTGYSQLRQLYGTEDWSGATVTAGIINTVENCSDLLFQDSSLLPLAGQALGPFASIVLKPESWKLSGSINYLFRSFERPTQPDGEVRSDRQLNLALKASRILSRRLSFYGSLDFTTNQSTLGSMSLDDRNYHQWVGTGGISWQIL